jgi:hypothetical protein
VVEQGYGATLWVVDGLDVYLQRRCRVSM